MPLGREECEGNKPLLTVSLLCDVLAALRLHDFASCVISISRSPKIASMKRVTHVAYMMSERLVLLLNRYQGRWKEAEELGVPLIPVDPMFSRSSPKASLSFEPRLPACFT